ncbi:MAG: metallophosphoesterase, partial [Paludibacteraceae bacterium]|nr:metallophosphoesterase [Paludibacteraceae bacterium]
WLKTQLHNRNQYRYCFIITHSNLTYQGFQNGVFTQEETVVLYDLFAKNNVNMIISGHSHRENDVTIEGVRYVTTGAIKSGEFGTCYVKNAGVDFKFEDLE